MIPEEPEHIHMPFQRHTTTDAFLRRDPAAPPPPAQERYHNTRAVWQFLRDVVTGKESGAWIMCVLICCPVLPIVFFFTIAADWLADP